jgi:hypothetical protein
MSKQAAKSKVVTPDSIEALTGVAFTVQASKDQGFSNYRICTLFLVDGKIVHIDKSQPFAAFEAIARTEMFVNSALWNLSSRYTPGAFQSLGGDQRDELINRLKATNPELLKKLAPALGLPREGTQ